MVQVCEASVASQYIVLFEETSRSENSFLMNFIRISIQLGESKMITLVRFVNLLHPDESKRLLNQWFVNHLLRFWAIAKTWKRNVGTLSKAPLEAQVVS